MHQDPTHRAADPGKKSDNDLAVAALRGDRSAFPVLVDRHLGALCSFFRYLGAQPGQVDDLVQETFYRAFRRLETYDPQRSFSTWLLSIARYLHYETYRQSKRTEIPVESLPDAYDPAIETRVVDRSMVEQALAKLSDESRLLVELRIYKDLPFAEIAPLLDEPETTLRVRFHRAMKRLRSILERG